MLVIGIGSLIMTDDGIGVRVADIIKDKLRAYDIEVILGETDVQYCLNEIRSDDFLVVIDSMMQGKEPGSLEIFPLQDVEKSIGKLHSQHDLSLMDAVTLNFPGIRGCLIGIEAEEIGFGIELSDALRERLERICENVFTAVVEMKEAAEHARHTSD
jgi:hydrogenase maturation protease